MASNVRNRSQALTISSPRGPVEVICQQWRSQKANSRWEWVWIARRRGQVQWRQATSAREAIHRATLLAAGKQPAWLRPFLTCSAGTAYVSLTTPTAGDVTLTGSPDDRAVHLRPPARRRVRRR
jgi:hypothetical protein